MRFKYLLPPKYAFAQQRHSKSKCKSTSQANRRCKQADVAITMSHKLQKLVKRNKEGHYI